MENRIFLKISNMKLMHITAKTYGEKQHEYGTFIITKIIKQSPPKQNAYMELLENKNATRIN